MATRAKLKRNNVGLPADRRENADAPSAIGGGDAPHSLAPLKGSGYERKWSKPAGTVPGAGVTTKSKGNGSW